MKTLKGNECIVSDQSIWNESTLGFINNFRQNNPQSVGHCFCNQFENDIAEANWSELAGMQWFLYLWDKYQQSLVCKTRIMAIIKDSKHQRCYLRAYNMPKLFIEQGRHTISPRRFRSMHLRE